jgi:hypothetical protein
MSEEATLYLQLLVGLVDKLGNRYRREDLLDLAAKHGFDGTSLFSHDDPAIVHAPMISHELLGIWETKEEPSVLFLQIIPTGSKEFGAAIERFRSLVAAILKEFNQDAIYWFPALRRPLENGFQNLLLKPRPIFRVDDLEFPDPREVFGRQVFRTLLAMRGPIRFGHPSLLVYESDWDGSPLFVPNCDWTPPYEERGQVKLIEANVRERYPFVRNVTLDITRDPQWRSSQTKQTGNRLKAQVFGDFANYTFQFARIDSPDLRVADPLAEYRDLKGRVCVFRTIDELFADSSTRTQNADVLRFLKERLGSLISDLK